MLNKFIRNNIDHKLQKKKNISFLNKNSAAPSVDLELSLK